LPEGWRASSISSGLQVGPPERTVLQLESQAAPLPSLERLLAALEPEKVVVLWNESTESFTGVRYRLAPGTEEGFLGVRRTGGRTVWCATVRGVRSVEIDLAIPICRELSGEPERGGSD
jgi:hypothetical protein